jgi:hypothetical protein
MTTKALLHVDSHRLDDRSGACVLRGQVRAGCVPPGARVLVPLNRSLSVAAVVQSVVPVAPDGTIDVFLQSEEPDEAQLLLAFNVAGEDLEVESGA